MQVRVGLENGIEGRVLAWALDYPGCFAYGTDGQSALIEMARAVPDYITWMEAHTPNPWFTPADIDIRLEEVFDVFYITEGLDRAESGYEVNAWFQMDWKPLTGVDVFRGLELLKWTRSDLLGTVTNLPDEVLDRDCGEGEYTIRFILRHIGTAEFWYLDRLGLSKGKESLPQDTMERLYSQRDRLREVLPGLAGISQVVGVDGEFWSPRKLLRRAVWHEVDHLLHIRRLLGKETTLASRA